MAGAGPEQSSRRWREVARLAMIGTAAAIGVSLVLTYLLFFSEALSPLARSLTLATIVPALIAAPLLVFIGVKLQELRQQRQNLNRLATYDQTTGLMNGTTLATVVDRRVHTSEVEDPARGGFLVVRLDNLLDINMRHGFDRGDEALRLVASAIRASVRESDTVGRLGAAEFGVFLAGASEENAREVGERIRAEIARVHFAPSGTETVLAVSAGGVVFDRDFGFNEMFRGAEHQLARRGSRSGLALARGASALPKPAPTTH
jgi:diguanylate cyclase